MGRWVQLVRSLHVMYTVDALLAHEVTDGSRADEENANCEHRGGAVGN